jgi:hypothetical protein
MTEQKCECPSDRHNHKAGECSKPATGPDQRCDDCRKEETAKGGMEWHQPLSTASQPQGLSAAVNATKGTHEPPR